MTYFREDITSHVSNLEEILWPSTTEQLSSEKRKRLESVRDIFETTLTNGSRRYSNSASRLGDSLSQDIVHGITKEKFIIEKHFLI